MADPQSRFSTSNIFLSFAVVIITGALLYFSNPEPQETTSKEAKAITRSQSRTQTAKNPSNPASQSPKSFRDPGLSSGLRKKDNGITQIREANVANEVAMLFGPWFSEMKLPTELQMSLLSLLADRKLLVNEVRSKLLRQGATDVEIERGVENETASIDNALMNAAGQNLYTEIKRRIPIATEYGNVRNTLSKSMALSQEQTVMLATAMKDVGYLDATSRGGTNAVAAEAWTRLVQQSSSFLSSEQVRVLQNYDSSRRANSDQLRQIIENAEAQAKLRAQARESSKK